LTLDANLKVINFQAEKTNVKHDFLADTEGINFPWLKPKVESSRAAMDESSDDEHVPLGECNAAEESSNSNLRFLNETIKKLSPIVRSESATGGRFLDPRKLRKSVNFVFMAFSSSTNVQLDVKLVESFVDFSKRFSAKHKFIFAYINVKPHESQSKYLSGVLNSNDLDWYTIHDLRYQVCIMEIYDCSIHNLYLINFIFVLISKKRVCKFYQVTMVPKLVVIDIRTGRVMNSRLKQCIVEFSHEFCEKRENNEETSTTSVSTTTATSSSDSEEASVVTVEEVAVKQCSNPEPVVSDPADELAHTSTETNYSDDDKFYNLNNIDKVQNIKFDFSNLNFNFETFDLVEHELFTEKSKRKKRASSTTTAAETASVCKKSKMKLLSEATLKQLNENLMDLSTGSKIAVKQEACEGSRPLHLLYFCSNSTVNEIYLQNVLNFLKYMQEKVRCSVRVVLVSLDEARGDYEQLVSKFAQKRRSSVRRVDELEKSSAERFVVDFEAAGVVREKLEKAFSISDLPHFSLIDSQNGQILSENLKIFILNSQLRDIVF
jgi:hypothetical protein